MSMSSENAILIVEDYQEMQEVMRFVLESSGYEVDCASTGEAALQLLRGGAKYSLLLLDNTLPDMTALTFIGKKNNENLAPQLPILICSASALISTQSWPAEVCGTLKKPFQIVDLLKAVKDLKNIPATKVSNGNSNDNYPVMP